MYTKTVNTKNVGSYRSNDKIRGLSSKPENAVKKLYPISKEIPLEIVDENEDIVKVSKPESEQQINEQEVSDSYQRNQRTPVRSKKNKSIIRKSIKLGERSIKRGNYKLKCDNFLVIERKYCFNENRLKNILNKFKIPLNHLNIRTMKEHAKETKNEVVDMKPALFMIKKLLPKSMRRKVGRKMRKTFRSISKSRIHAEENENLESPVRESEHNQDNSENEKNRARCHSVGSFSHLTGNSDTTQQKLNTGRKAIDRKLSNYNKYSSPYLNKPKTAISRKKETGYELSNTNIMNSHQNFGNNLF